MSVPKQMVILHNSNKTTKNDSIYQNRLRSCFTNALNYLDSDETLVVGRKPKGPRYNNDNLSVVHHSIVGAEALSDIFDKLSPKKQNQKIKDSLTSQTKLKSRKFSLKDLIFLRETKENTPRVKTNDIIKNPYENMRFPVEAHPISENEIDDKIRIFEKTQYSNFNKDKSEFYKDLSDYNRTRIALQEKSLTNFSESVKDTQSIKKHIANVIHRSETKLLMHESTEKYNRKKYFFNNDIAPMSSLMKWMISLRHSKKDQYRMNFVNVNTEQNPIIHPYLDKNKSRIITIKPNTNVFPPKIKKKNPYLRRCSVNFEACQERMSELANNSIRGKSLLSYEKDLCNRMKGKKIIYYYNYNNPRYIKSSKENLESNESVFMRSYSTKFLQSLK